MANYGGPHQAHDPRHQPQQAPAATYQPPLPQPQPTAIPGEEVILESSNGALRVSTHRVRYVIKQTGSAKFASIMLDAVTSCEVTYLSYPALLVFSGLVFLGGLLMNSARDSTPLSIGSGGAIALGIAYLLTRRQVVRVSSPSAHIDVPLSGLDFSMAVRIVDVIEAARNAQAPTR